jgi:hypothetical protein
MLTRQDLKTLTTKYGVSYRHTFTEGISQYRFSKKGWDTVLVVRLEPDIDGKVAVGYTTESLRRKPNFELLAICNPGDCLTHVESLVEVMYGGI